VINRGYIFCGGMWIGEILYDMELTWFACLRDHRDRRGLERTNETFHFGFCERAKVAARFEFVLDNCCKGSSVHRDGEVIRWGEGMGNSTYICIKPKLYTSRKEWVFP